MYSHEQRIKNAAAGGTAIVGLLVVLASTLLALVLLPFTALGRFVRVIPWTVLAQKRTPVSGARTWEVYGWRASSRLLHDVRVALEEGRRLPR